MKFPSLLLAFMLVPSAFAGAQNAKSPNPTFDWKLQLKPRQKWIHHVSIFSSSEDEGFSFVARLDLKFQNEVLFANPNEYLISTKFTQCDMYSRLLAGGRDLPEPDRTKFTPAFVGIPFKIKQTVRGKIIAISGLEKLVENGRQYIRKSKLSKNEQKELERYLPPVENLKYIITKYQQLIHPAVPLAVGTSYSHNFEAFPSFQDIEIVPVKSRLRAFDERVARFDEHGELSTYTNNPEFRPVRGDGERAYQTFKGLLSGQTTVDIATGLPQRDLNLQATIKTTVIDAKRKRRFYSQKKQVQVAIATKLNS